MGMSQTRMMMTLPQSAGLVGGGGGVYQGNEPNSGELPHGGRVTRCVMPRYDESVGYSGTVRSRIPEADPTLTEQGFRQTGNRCGPGGYGVEYEGPQTPFFGQPPGMAGMEREMRPYQRRRCAQLNRARARCNRNRARVNQALAGLGEVGDGAAMALIIGVPIALMVGGSYLTRNVVRRPLPRGY